MLISELMKELEKVKAAVGDVQVEVRNPAGDIDYASDVRAWAGWRGQKVVRIEA